MKQVQSGISLARPSVGSSMRPMGPVIVRSTSGLWAALGIVWGLVTLPFRLAFRLIALLGRLAGIAIGFSMMVVGMFFLAGPFFLIGIPLFCIGLILTLRCLD
jgi:hypothetical protein